MLMQLKLKTADWHHSTRLELELQLLNFQRDFSTSAISSPIPVEAQGVTHQQRKTLSLLVNSGLAPLYVNGTT